MDKKELLKKYWFVGLLAIVFLVFIGAYIVDAYKNREIYVSNKQVDGEYIAYSVDDKNVTADTLYEDLFNESSSGAKAGILAAYTQYQRAVLDKAYETTTEMNDQASYNAYYVMQQYTEEQVASDLIRFGFTEGSKDLPNYYILGYKYNKLLKDFYLNDYDKYLKSTIEETNPRIIYHIQVKVADKDNPTQEEKDKIAKVQEELKTKEFTQVAYEMSEDSSASNYGYLGLCDTSFNPSVEDGSSNKYVQEFYDAAMALKDDEVSDVITTEYGYHIIWCSSANTDDLLENNDFLAKIEQAYPTSSIEALVQAAEKNGFEIVNEDLKDYITKALESEAK